MIRIALLEESDMEKVVDKVMHKHGALPAPVLVSYCLRELEVKAEDFDRWHEQLCTYLTERLFESSDIALTLPR